MSFWEYVALQVSDQIIDYKTNKIWVVTRHNVDSGVTYLHPFKQPTTEHFHDDDDFGADAHYWAEEIMRMFILKESRDARKKASQVGHEGSE